MNYLGSFGLYESKYLFKSEAKPFNKLNSPTSPIESDVMFAFYKCKCTFISCSHLTSAFPSTQPSLSKFDSASIVMQMQTQRMGHKCLRCEWHNVKLWQWRKRRRQVWTGLKNVYSRCKQSALSRSLHFSWHLTPHSVQRTPCRASPHRSPSHSKQ